MNNEVYQEVYGHILNDAQRIRKEIMNEWGDTLMFGGTMPNEVLEDLSNVARITGLSFDALSGHGVAFSQVDGKPELYRLNVRGENYVCHKSAIPSMSGFLDVVNVPGVTAKVEPAPTKKETVTQNNSRPDYGVKEDVPSYQGGDSRADEYSYPSYEKNHDYEEGDTYETPSPDSYESQYEEDPTDDSLQNEPEDNAPFEEDPVEPESDSNAEEEEPIPESEPEPEPIVEEEPPRPSYPTNTAEIIGGTSKISTFKKSDIFMEEYSKNVDDLVYEMFDINLSHSGFSGGGRPERMTVMIAPLKIQRVATSIVPIIVSIYCDGRIITKSSYDQREDGKNLVTLDVKEFYLLFRGTFDANGKFQGFVTTTGISAAQGDILTVSSSTQFGDPESRTVNNGHIKVRSMIDDTEGTIEVFPFGDPEDDEFILMTKNDEFVDYIYISDSAKGLKKPIIYCDDIKKQAICSWDKDHTVMNFELKEV